MIALDTNALIRMLIEDDATQAKVVKDIVLQVEAASGKILILSEVLIETVWVLESVYACKRAEISDFLELLLENATFSLAEPTTLRSAASQYKRSGDFADLVIVNQSKRHKAEKLISFDKKLQKRFTAYVVETIKQAY
jgi:predicted nucleic-acid-binding protein